MLFIRAGGRLRNLAFVGVVAVVVAGAGSTSEAAQVSLDPQSSGRGPAMAERSALGAAGRGTSCLAEALERTELAEARARFPGYPCRGERVMPTKSARRGFGGVGARCWGPGGLLCLLGTPPAASPSPPSPPSASQPPPVVSFRRLRLLRPRTVASGAQPSPSPTPSFASVCLAWRLQLGLVRKRSNELR